MTDASADPGGLGRRSITAMLWGTGGAIVRIAIQVISQIILARLLGPELYGVFAVALVVVLLSGLFADVGLAYGLIQKASVSADDMRFVFTWQLLLGTAMTTVLWLAAPHLARLYGDPRIDSVLAWLAPSCLIYSASATSGAMLRREMDFKTINIASVVSYAGGFFGVAIPMALAGAGVGALVAGYLVQASLQAIILYARCRHPLEPLLWQPGARGILDFGLTVLGTNVVNWALSSIDRAIVGMTLGLAAAGLYATAYNLISTPLFTALAVVQSIFYSASSKVQGNPEQLGRGLCTLSGTACLLAAPVFAGVAATAETIFVTLYGARWTGGGDVLAPLALAVPAQLVMSLATPVLWASGATRRELELQIPIALGWIVALAAISQLGSLALLGWAVCLLLHVRAGVVIWATVAEIDLPMARLVRACRPGLMLSAVVGVAGFAADRLLAPKLGIGVHLLACDIAVCAIALLAGLRLLGPRLDDNVIHVFSQLADRLPGDHGPFALRFFLGR